MTFGVLIPTHRRTADLTRCLDAIAAQRRPPDQVVVIVRDTDVETRRLLGHRPAAREALRVLVVSRPGVVAALNVGLAVIRNDIVAITDDDAVPRPDWLERIEQHFQRNPRATGVGGRDYIAAYSGTPERSVVGILQWHGRVIGNHHLGSGPPREVDVLKGVNMSLRRSAIRPEGLDERLLGDGAQVHWELACCLALRRQGGALIYDPAIAVDHYPGWRSSEQQRASFNPRAVRDAVHNETLVLLEYLPTPRKVVFLIWAILVGTSAAPGLAQYLRFMVGGREHAGAHFMASLSGRKAGWHTWRAS